MKSELRMIRPAHLALRNGQDQPQVWIAYKGFAYDAPHTDEAGARFAAIGRLP